jgi:hypothetical protein
MRGYATCTANGAGTVSQHLRMSLRSRWPQAARELVARPQCRGACDATHLELKQSAALSGDGDEYAAVMGLYFLPVILIPSLL